MVDEQNVRWVGKPAARRTSSQRSPFAGAGFGIAIALAAVVASLVWRIADGALPGGRWPAVHLFTLGALTPLIATFMPRFAAALLHARSNRSSGERIQMVVLLLGAGMTIAGRLTAITVLLATGATVLTFAIGLLYAGLRRERRNALPGRFTFIVRAYERACGAFFHGALLGVLLGAGVFGGAWYAAARAAHLQLMLFGWGGLTLLATLVMFGPAVMRARMLDGADSKAARALPRAATAVSVAAFALIVSGSSGTLGIAGRFTAAAALVVYGWSVIAVCGPVLRTSVRATPSAARSFVVASAIWFMVAISLDVVSTVAALPAWTDAASVALLTGVLLHSILATLTHVLPLLVGRDAAERRVIGNKIATFGKLRTAALSAGALLVTAGSGVATEVGSDLVRIGWGLVATAVALTAALICGAVARAARTSQTRPTFDSATEPALGVTRDLVNPGQVTRHR